MLIWMRAEPRNNEARAPLTPAGAAKLIDQGWRVVVEDDENRAIPTEDYRDQGCEIAPPASWINAPDDTIILGLKELDDDGTALPHTHIMFGHAYKGQADGRILLDRFKKGGGTLLDLEYLVDGNERRVAAFGYWAGFAGAAVSLLALAAQRNDQTLGKVSAYASADDMVDEVRKALQRSTRVIIIGAKGRVGSGAADLCKQVGITPTEWDKDETAHGGPFPEVLEYDVFLNCILAHKGAPVFVDKDATDADRQLRVIGDIACDPTSDFSPIKVYDQSTTWGNPTTVVHRTPPLEVMAIDNLPSLMPTESTEDFADQLLPYLLDLKDDKQGVWARARATFKDNV
ncbi:saccharopine dehydrogenase [Pseudooctadecabacter jejudonensis]|uniref:Saccharopine dehydrogenase [NAD(+), L-lysine-forming] n=1 Tax=Pseudooctadecabacter jejudonensis TaxID=1391910 RepID=A0A1Y5SB13_9RHOB|nr:saccharopine dehydrogenase [Pseudooctadecabacter jejudonensis]SLN36308.1 Alanine dehydrogenase [Pseudooctadecabacter jejudonensis]